MEKDLHMSVLLDYYGKLLTSKQLELMSYYYNQDLTLTEIAENQHITRQAVRDTIKKAEAQLFHFEETLKFYETVTNYDRALEKIKSLASENIDKNSKEIVSIADSFERGD